MTTNERTFNAREAHRLDDPERLAWLPPAEVIAQLGLRNGMNVADIGAGTGYFTIPIAGAIGPGGTVYAVDFQREMLRRLNKNLQDTQGSVNVKIVEGEARATHLPDRSVDLVLMSNLWHELDAYTAVLAEISRILRPGGRLAILDWRADHVPPPGPPSEHRIPQATVLKTLSGAGWPLLHSGSAGRFSYLLIAAAPGNLNRQ